MVAWLPKDKRNAFKDVMDKVIPPTTALESDDEEEEDGDKPNEWNKFIKDLDIFRLNNK